MYKCSLASCAEDFANEQFEERTERYSIPSWELISWFITLNIQLRPPALKQQTDQKWFSLFISKQNYFNFSKWVWWYRRWDRERDGLMTTAKKLWMSITNAFTCLFARTSFVYILGDALQIRKVSILTYVDTVSLVNNWTNATSVESGTLLDKTYFSVWHHSQQSVY